MPDKDQAQLAFELGRSDALVVTLALEALNIPLTFDQISNVGNTVISYVINQLPEAHADSWHKGFMEVYMPWAQTKLPNQN